MLHYPQSLCYPTCLPLLNHRLRVVTLDDNGPLGTCGCLPRMLCLRAQRPRPLLPHRIPAIQQRTNKQPIHGGHTPRPLQSQPLSALLQPHGGRPSLSLLIRELQPCGWGLRPP